MKYKITTIFVAALAFVVLFSLNAFAGNKDKVGTVAAAELMIPIGARDLAMGGSTIALSSGIESVFWNPAGLAYSETNASAMFSRLQYIADINMNYVAVAGKFGGFGTVGFSIKSLDLGDIAITTEDFPDGTGGFVSPTFFVLGVHYARNISDRVAVGFTGNFINEDLSEARVKATGFSFSAGVQYKNLANLEGLDFGVAVKNIGPQMGFSGSGLLRNAEVGDVSRGGSFVEIKAASDELPSTIELGLAYTIKAGETSKLVFTGMFQNNNFSDDETSFGGEYSFNNLFFVRGGWNFAPDADEDAYIFGGTLGAGFHVKVGGVAVTADYGWRQTDFFENQNAFSIKLGF
jgi:hypothetical protein